MRWRWKVVRWSLFAIVLASIAMGLFVWLPPAPRWIVRGHCDSLGFSPDGKILRMRKDGANGPGTRIAGCYGQWDLGSGREIRTFLNDINGFVSGAITPDGRTLYALARHGSDKFSVKLHKIDLDAGADTEATVETETLDWHMHVAPGGKLVLLSSCEQQERLIWANPDHLPIGDGGRLYDANSLRLAIKEDARKWTWQWAPDGDALPLYAAHDNGKTTLRRITPKEETITILDGAGNWLAISPDGKTLFTAPPASEAEEGSPLVLRWDTATGLRLDDMSGAVGVTSLGSGSFCENAGRVACFHLDEAGNAQVVVWDLNAHRQLALVPRGDRALAASRELDMFLLYGQGSHDTLAMYRPWPFAKLWQRDLAGGITGNGVEFLADTKRLRMETGDKGEYRVLLLDVETGEVCLDVPVLDQYRVIARGRFMAIEETIQIETDNRGWFWETIDDLYAKLAVSPMAHASYKTVTRVYDTETGAQLGRLELHGATFAELSPDGSSLFMQEDESAGGLFCCYAVPASLRWGWIIGLPACLGAVSVTGRTAWRGLWRWRAKQRAVKVVA